MTRIGDKVWEKLRSVIKVMWDVRAKEQWSEGYDGQDGTNSSYVTHSGDAMELGIVRHDVEALWICGTRDVQYWGSST